MTAAEMALWLHLRKGICDLKFRRQHPMGMYIADFFCHGAKLIIEVDGSVHNVPEVINADKERQNDLESWGYSVLRFTNNEVLKTPEIVLQKIEAFILNQKDSL